jgi:CheY-like chemotaxis protein/glycine cleavage system H lipoate-binding protein
VNGERPAYDVLLVEDEPVVREAAARILRPEGLTLDRVEDVASALARLRKADHRLVVADLMLPGFSGFDLLERVTGERPTLPVILVTGYATLENALAAFKKGAFDFLPKPFDVPELLGVVRRALAAVELGRWRSPAPPEPEEGAAAGERRFLGQHAWIAVDGEVASCGLAESWPGLVRGLTDLRLPRPGDPLTQGLAFAELAAGDDAIHRVWAPLGGTVVEVNPRLREDPDLLNRAPFTSGWMVRVAPSDLAHELDALTLRAPAATAARGGGGEEKRWSF